MDALARKLTIQKLEAALNRALTSSELSITERVIAYLDGCGEQTEAELLAGVSGRKQTKIAMIRLLHKVSAIFRKGDGRKGAPFVYYLADGIDMKANDPFQTPMAVPEVLGVGDDELAMILSALEQLAGARDRRNTAKEMIEPTG
jgi:hypothetical protein